MTGVPVAHPRQSYLLPCHPEAWARPPPAPHLRPIHPWCLLSLTPALWSILCPISSEPHEADGFAGRPEHVPLPGTLDALGAPGTHGVLSSWTVSHVMGLKWRLPSTEPFLVPLELSTMQVLDTQPVEASPWCGPTGTSTVDSWFQESPPPSRGFPGPSMPTPLPTWRPE